MHTPHVFSKELQHFIGAEQWKFATMLPDWPHEYLVRERVDRQLFERMVKHIRSQGYEGRFYEREIRYYEEADLVYWTIGAPVEQTVIINRCSKKDRDLQCYGLRLLFAGAEQTHASGEG